MIDDTGHLMTKAEMLEKAKTETGRREIAEYIFRARTAYATQAVLERLNTIPDAETQQACCQIIYDTLFRVSVFDIMDYCKSVAEGIETSDLDCVGRA